MRPFGPRGSRRFQLELLAWTPPPDVEESLPSPPLGSGEQVEQSLTSGRMDPRPTPFSSCLTPVVPYSSPRPFGNRLGLKGQFPHFWLPSIPMKTPAPPHPPPPPLPTPPPHPSSTVLCCAVLCWGGGAHTGQQCVSMPPRGEGTECPPTMWGNTAHVPLFLVVVTPMLTVFSQIC